MIVDPILPNPTGTVFQHTPTKVSFPFDASFKQAAIIMLGIVTQQGMEDDNPSNNQDYAARLNSRFYSSILYKTNLKEDTSTQVSKMIYGTLDMTGTPGASAPRTPTRMMPRARAPKLLTQMTTAKAPKASTRWMPRARMPRAPTRKTPRARAPREPRKRVP